MTGMVLVMKPMISGGTMNNSEEETSAQASTDMLLVMCLLLTSITLIGAIMHVSSCQRDDQVISNSVTSSGKENPDTSSWMVFPNGMM
jgi:hypothetical protein